jgi:tRNA U34 5-methylaminomethyl-2-thiouridine-forming methyltransferase MnmC
MKHWNTLTELESSLIRLGEFKNLFELLTNGVDNECSREVINSAIYTMHGMIENINDEAMANFHTLWEEIRQDSDSVPAFEGETEDFAQATHFYSNEKEPYNPDEEEAFQRLEEAIKTWKNVSPAVNAFEPYNPDEKESFKRLEDALRTWKNTSPGD